MAKDTGDKTKINAAKGAKGTETDAAIAASNGTETPAEKAVVVTPETPGAEPIVSDTTKTESGESASGETPVTDEAKVETEAKTSESPAATSDSVTSETPGAKPIVSDTTKTESGESVPGETPVTDEAKAAAEAVENIENARLKGEAAGKAAAEALVLEANRNKPQPESTTKFKMVQHEGEWYELTIPGFTLNGKHYTHEQAADKPDVIKKLVEMQSAALKKAI